jgi:hypothetical protein
MASCTVESSDSDQHTSPKNTYIISHNGTDTLKMTIKRKKFKCKSIGELKLRVSRLISKEKPLEGFRLIHTDMLQDMLDVSTSHVAECTLVRVKLLSGAVDKPIKLLRETRTHGLASEIRGQCQGCFKLFLFKTSPLIDSSGEHRRHEVNLRAVWGAMATGSGNAQLNELVCTLGLHGITQATFSAIEHEIGSCWQTVLQQDMLAAGREEKRLAIERGDFHDGIPAITVICDGGWSKRSHKHTYNALGGVAIVIGAATGKLLHVGIRNKTCYICTSADTKQVTPPEHECFKNWTGSSQAMEADIIVDGFLSAETTHGVRYMRLVGDGDSSVYAKIMEQVPVWGAHVAKVECSNHACKCLRSNLEKLVQDHPSFKGKGKLTLMNRIKITTGVRCAIRMRSKEADRVSATKALAHDIRNAVYHVFGMHNSCFKNFCKAGTDSTTSDQPPVDSAIDFEGQDDDVDNVLSEQNMLWSQGTSEAAMEAVRHGESSEPDPDQSEAIRAIGVLLNRMAEKAHRLIGNDTTNLAESWMAIRLKFDGGKIFNRCHRGSWHARCFGGAMRKNLGPQWSPKVWSVVTNTPATAAFEQLYVTREKQLGHCKSSKAKPEVKLRARKRRTLLNVAARSKAAKMAYGRKALDVVPDLQPEGVQEAKDKFLLDNVHHSQTRLKEIEKQTRLQAACPLWKSERRCRLTASTFKDVVVRNPTRPVGPLVQRFLYGTFSGNRYTRAGLANESVATQEYVMYKSQKGVKVQVHSTGLVVHPTHQYLAASPDGKVCEVPGSTGLLEIKTVLQNNRLTFEQAAVKQTNFCLKLVDGKLQVKPTHPFMYQCQGQMNVADMPWVDLLIRRTQPYQLYIERILQDKAYWSNHMRPKLEAFYFGALLPELAVPRYGKSPGIREPGVWVRFNCVYIRLCNKYEIQFQQHISL